MIGERAIIALTLEREIATQKIRHLTNGDYAFGIFIYGLSRLIAYSARLTMFNQLLWVPFQTTSLSALRCLFDVWYEGYQVSECFSRTRQHDGGPMKTTPWLMGLLWSPASHLHTWVIQTSLQWYTREIRNEKFIWRTYMYGALINGERICRIFWGRVWNLFTNIGIFRYKKNYKFEYCISLRCNDRFLKCFSDNGTKKLLKTL